MSGASLSTSNFHKKPIDPNQGRNPEWLNFFLKKSREFCGALVLNQSHNQSYYQSINQFYDSCIIW